MDTIDIALFISYGLTILAAAAAIIFPIVNSISQPQTLIKSGIGLGAILVVFLLSWAISGNEVSKEYAEFGVQEGLSKFIGGLLIMMYALIALALGGIVYTEISKAVK